MATNCSRFTVVTGVLGAILALATSVAMPIVGRVPGCARYLVTLANISSEFYPVRAWGTHLVLPREER